MNDFDVAMQRLKALANNPKTPAAVAGDLSLVLLTADASDRKDAEIEKLKAENAEQAAAIGRVRKLLGDCRKYVSYRHMQIEDDTERRAAYACLENIIAETGGGDGE
jgi:hypothetical protein